MGNEKVPHGREKQVTSAKGSVKKSGEGLNLGGPVGNSGGPGKKSGGNSGKREGGLPKGGLIGIIAAIIAALGGGGFALSGLGGSGSTGTGTVQESAAANTGSQSGSETQGSGGILDALGGFSGYSFAGTSSGWKAESNSQKLDLTTREGSREKRTKILGDGKDTVTIMVYMCGTDLESRSGMATSDIEEMCKATLSDKVNVLIYTGGCKGWKNSVISSSKNQIYQVKNGGLVCLESDMGSGAMTDGKNLTTFIQYCTKNYPANRQELIFWDHGGGSVTGYGYDEKVSGSGSMSLEGINKALKNAGTTFDFIGFDACLMATMENALMLDAYADYLIASEESEPGYGWYYTNWLTALSKDPSLSTVEIGKQIADDFVSFCKQKGQGSITTLSVTDLAELGTFGPEAMNNWAKSATQLIKNEDYKTVSNARANTKEFAQSSKIDQVDLAHLALNTGTKEGQALFDVITGAVKYNHVASNITNAYGLSAYFPYKKAAYVDRAVKTYDAIGMDNDYSSCIRAFASVETAGQAASGGTGSPISSLLGQGLSNVDVSALGDLFGSLMGRDLSGIEGLDESNTEFLEEENLEDYVSYIGSNSIHAEELFWADSEDGPVLSLTEAQWDLVQELALSVFVDDGEGFIELGTDNVYEFTEDGKLKGTYDGTWLAIDGQPVAYYFLSEEDDGDTYSIHGYVPALLNGERVDLMLVFDSENPYGYIEGTRIYYEDGETETVAKSDEPLKEGDVLEFICDYYSYDGEFLNNYKLGDAITIGETVEISNVSIGDVDAVATYRITDIYNKQFWTPEISE